VLSFVKAGSVELVLVVVIKTEPTLLKAGLTQCLADNTAGLGATDAVEFADALVPAAPLELLLLPHAPNARVSALMSVS
jgi:hypothetical protein